MQGEGREEQGSKEHADILEISIRMRMITEGSHDPQVLVEHNVLFFSSHAKILFCPHA